MKKGLLSILASVLLVVGCQNYDDQFSALETQINALASTVAGLSQVQSDLSSLAGTVNSLASTVNGLGSQIDTAVSDGLADIQADITAIETAVADVASSEDVAAIDAALDTAQSDLTDLLAASSVFTGSVIVNSVNTLDAYLAMGAALNIVNGSVDITVKTSMDQTKVQSLVDNILTVVNDFKYTSEASTIAETTFNNLTGVQSLTITQGGGMRFPNLVSATNIFLKDDFESTVDVIHFGSLTSVSGIDTDAETNTIRFTKATELHLTSLLYYPGATLTIETDEGAAMPFVLDDIDADGDTLTAGLTLTITGPASFSSSQIADGTLDFTDVKSVNLTDFKGAVTIGGDVESFTSNSLVSLSVDAATKVETVDVTGVVDPDATTAATKIGPTINFTSLGDLETVTIAGIAADITLSTNNNLASATISADVSGLIQVDNNSDLTTLTVTGATAYALDVDTNADLAALTVDLTWGNDNVLTVVDGDLDVTGNTSLETLTVSSDNLENLEVTANTSLATVDFTGVTKIGATGTAVVNIYNNDLTATKLTDATDGTTDVADGGVGDLGSVTSTSGMSTLKTYLTAVDADADSAASVYWDKVESFVDSEAATDVETTDISTGYATSAQDATTILLLSANSADTGDAATTGKRSFLINPAGQAAAFSLIVNGIDLLEDAATNAQNLAATTSGTALGTNFALATSRLLDVATLALADIAGVSLALTDGGTATSYIGFGANGTAGQNSATVLNSIMTLNASDTVTIAIDGYSVTVSGTQTNNAFDTAANMELFITEIQEQWYDNYGGDASTDATVASDATVRWTLTSVADQFGGALTSPTKSLKFVAKDNGTPAIGTVPTVTITSGKTATYTNLGYLIGNDNNKTVSTADDGAEGLDYILTITADTAGLTLGEVGVPMAAYSQAAKGVGITSAGAAGSVSELMTNRAPNATASYATTTTNSYVDQSRTDAIIPENANSAAASNAVSFSRVGWLG